MDPTVLSVIIGVVVITLFGGVGLILAKPASLAEQRLDGLAVGRGKAKADAAASGLLRPQHYEPGTTPGWPAWLPKLDGLGQLCEQADVGLSAQAFVGLSAGLALAGAVVGYALKIPLALLPFAAVPLGLTPFAWLVLRKRKRIKAFVTQMPDALELVGRALRAGHGLASGLDLVAQEMPPPISEEFGRIYEEQNLGIPLEEALRSLADRVPTMDVRFFVTAVVVQRGTGGDLAEVLDKIGRLIRERFQILGQVQALTAEGRLSGVVLLAMPPSLLAFCYMTNPEYIDLLFSTPIGVKMLTVAGILQLVGALAIKKIITIKV